MPDLVAVLRDQPADHRHQPGGDLAALRLGQGRALFSAECRLARHPRLKPCGGLVDDVERGLIAVLGRVGPGEEPVAFQHATLGLRVFGGEFLQPQAQIIAGFLPWQPADLVAEDLGRQLAGIHRCRDGDDGVGMDVIDMLSGHIGMQRRVDGGRARVQRKGAMGQIADHLILKCGAAILAFQGAELVHVKRRKAVQLH